MNENVLWHWGAAISRIALGVVALAHSLYLKGVVYTLAGTAQFFGSVGLPPFLAYVVFTVEVIAGVMLLAGWRVRVASLALLPVMLGATWVHWSFGWLFTNANGGWEYPAFLAVAALVQALLGEGAMALQLRRAGSRHTVPGSALET